MNVTRKRASNYLTNDLVSHTRRVCSLYKKMLRDVDYCEENFLDKRYKQLQIRAEFDKNKNIKDARVAKALLEQTEKKFDFEMHPYHAAGIQFLAYSKDGIAYGRALESPDYVMDYYHPLEKARFPYYFSKREAMKDEYVRMWKKKMMRPGVPEGGSGHH